jgi:hypothetical protein
MSMDAPTTGSAAEKLEANWALVLIGSVGAVVLKRSHPVVNGVIVEFTARPWP